MARMSYAQPVQANYQPCPAKFSVPNKADGAAAAGYAPCRMSRSQGNSQSPLTLTTSPGTSSVEVTATYLPPRDTMHSVTYSVTCAGDKHRAPAGFAQASSLSLQQSCHPHILVCPVHAGCVIFRTSGTLLTRTFTLDHGMSYRRSVGIRHPL